MAFPVRRCALVGRLSDPRVAESVAALLPHLSARQVQVIVGEDAPLGQTGQHVLRVAEREIGAHADLVIAIGGDGTLLYAAGLVARHGDMFVCVDAALQGRLQADERPLLAACLRSANGQPVAEALALNDVVLQKHATGRMLDFETKVDGDYVNTHAGDGIIVASATGSTAYALSCGGPIIEPHLDVLVMTPICPHTLSDRPIVVSARSLIEVALLERPDTYAQVACDGIVLGEIAPGDRLQVKSAAERITLLHPDGHDYYRLLRSKLHWGRGSFER